MKIEDGAFEPDNQKSVVKPYALTHGTMECHDLKKTREFMEDFLGFECVRHAPVGMLMRCGMKFHIVCLETGDEVRPNTVANHWGVDVESRDEVDKAHAKLTEMKDYYGIKDITQPQMQHGVYSFYFECMNSSWWEIQYYDGFLHDDFFDFGDQYTDSQLSKVAIPN